MKAYGKAVSLIAAACTLAQLCILPVRALDSSVSGYHKGAANSVVIQIKAKPKTTSRANSTPAKDLSQEDLEKYTRKEYDAVPLYFQTDYPDTMYGNSTIAKGGCSVTALAMVATYLTGYEYLPNELAYYFGGRAENNIERLTLGSDAMGLPYKYMKDWPTAMQALKEGKIVVMMMNEKSILTDTQHFVILTDLTEDGKILVHDPYEPNYDRWDLKNAFVEGFEEGDLCWGFDGAWAYDKSQMPQEIDRYEQALPNQDSSQSRYPGLTLTVEEKQLLAKVIWVEARGECAEGQQAVAEVILNRLASGEFGETLSGVIFDEGQFRSVAFLEDAKPYQAQYMAVEGALNGPYVLPMDVYHFATYPATTNIWGEIGGHIFCYDWDWVPGQEASEETAETTPAETTPAETTPAETTPEETVPKQTAPAQTVPQETEPGETVYLEFE